MNQYWTVPSTLLEEIKKRGVTNSLQPHENVHWSLSNDGSKAIVQGNFDDALIVWLKKQIGTSKLGDYIKGKAEKKVYDFIQSNKEDWESKELIV